MERYDVIIVGLGPAGVAAAIYSGRKKMKTLIIGKEIGGQSIVSRTIYNWICIPEISGVELAMKMEEHLESVKEDVAVRQGETVVSIEKKEDSDGLYFSVTTDRRTYQGRTVLLASGSGRRKLGIPGEAEYSGKGVFYCSICDAPLMQGKVAAVIGGGNAGLEAVIDLMPYAQKIYLLEVAGSLRGDESTQEKVWASNKVEIILNAKALSITGEKFVNGLEFENVNTHERKNIGLGGVFIEVGSIPNSGFKGIDLKKDANGYVIVDPYSGKTNIEGVWAAGDITSLPYKQNNIAMGDSIRAILNIYDFLISKK